MIRAVVGGLGLLLLAGCTADDPCTAANKAYFAADAAGASPEVMARLGADVARLCARSAADAD